MYAAAAVMLGDSDEASDAVQEAFGRLWEKRGQIPTPQNAEAYCVTVIKRMCIDRLRRRVHSVPAGADTLPQHPDSTTERSIEASSSLARLMRLMQTLPPQQRQVIELNALSGLDNSEIARVTGISNVNVRALLSRGRRQLRKLFETE